MVTIVAPAKTYGAIIHVAEKGVIFKRIRAERIYEWERITHIFRWRRWNLLTVITAEGTVATGNVYPDEHFRKASEKITHIWDVWKGQIVEGENIRTFEYPAWCRDEEARLTLHNAFTGIGAGIILSFLLARLFLEDSWKNWTTFKDALMPVGGVLLAMYAFIFGLKNLIEHFKNKPVELIIENSDIQVLYSSGDAATLKIGDIQKHELEDVRSLGVLVFKDGTKLKRLDRFSYWPILRDYLLSKLG
jgi:hypothetical protein